MTVQLVCPEGHEFSLARDDFLSQARCPQCGAMLSPADGHDETRIDKAADADAATSASTPGEADPPSLSDPHTAETHIAETVSLEIGPALLIPGSAVTGDFGGGGVEATEAESAAAGINQDSDAVTRSSRADGDGRTTDCEPNSEPDSDPEATLKVPLVGADEHGHCSDKPRGAASRKPSDRRYTLQQDFAHGGIGRVWLAQDETICRQVAYKVLRSAAAKNRTAVERFLEEAQITGQLEHPGVVPIYDLGWQEGGAPYYSMKLIHGTTLEDAITACHALPRRSGERRLAFTRLLRSFVDVCNTLAFAHDRGVLHRDLKPLNVMLGAFGETVVLDWGLAKLVGNGEAGEATAASASDGRTVSQEDTQAERTIAYQAGAEPERPDSGSQTDFSLQANAHDGPATWGSSQSFAKRTVTTNVRSEGSQTLVGSIMGTPAYMAPEQAQGDISQLDARTDVYSLGAILYKILSGHQPFSERNSRAMLKKVVAGNVDPPRTHDATIPKPLEAICLKALSKEKSHRYSSAMQLAADVEAYLADEPVSAYQEPWYARLRRWVRRHRTLATTAAVVVVMAAVVWIGWGRLESRNRALAQVARLRNAAPASMPILIDSLRPFRGTVEPHLDRLCRQADLTDNERVRLRLARLSLSDSDSETRLQWTQELSRDLLQADADEFLMIRQVLLPDATALTPALWQTAMDGQADKPTRFRAGCALAEFDPNAAQWDHLTGDVAGRLLAEPPFALRDWITALRPIRDRLLPVLKQAFDSAPQPDTRTVAAMVLAEMFADRLPVLIELVRTAEERQLAALVPKLPIHAQQAAGRLQVMLRAANLQTVDRRKAEELASEAANVAMALLSLSVPETDAVWPVLSQGPDKRIRSHVIHRLGRVGIDPAPLIRRLQEEQDPIVLVALMLSLGEYGSGTLLASERAALLPQLVQWHGHHPHPGVHSASEWLLREWGYAEQAAAALNQSKVIGSPGPLQWYANSQGHTMAVFPGPVEFWMGSPNDEPNRVTTVGLEQVDVEMRHRRRIPRSFAVATREVTVEQYLKSREDHPTDKKYTPENTCPIIQVHWFDAAKYCRWLSEQEGIPDEQMCYPPIEKIGPTMSLPKDLLARTGYRLPTAAEWEYTARAGAATSRHFGETGVLLPEYAWFFSNAEDHSWPVGRLKPNDFGLFDVHGNVMEWCQSWYFDDPTNKGERLVDGVIADHADERRGIYREIRGGSYRSRSELIRIADRDHDSPFIQSFEVGFRVARTQE